ncbi:HNH endonuclease [Streptomyces sp. NPDC058442]|uniref:HNH endonuclease n=1 Tax=Streptomyces sp. NPDC058442 TaxID=3346503 RepID=UPI00364F667D
MTAYTQEIGKAGKPVDRARGLWKHTTVRHHVHTVLSATLAEMAPGVERCMYCGDNQGTDIDHFEPLSRAPLRTFDWSNHLLACSLCNSHQKREAFPVDPRGRPLLIDPSSEDPADHLHLVLAVGEYLPLTPGGEATCEVFGLNRGVLVRGRRKVYRITRLCIEEWLRAHEKGDDEGVREWTSTVWEQPTAAVVYAMFHQAMAPGAKDVFADDPGVLRLLTDERVRAGLLG